MPCERLYALDPREAFGFSNMESVMGEDQKEVEEKVVYVISGASRYCNPMVLKVTDYQPTKEDLDAALEEHAAMLLDGGKGMDAAAYELDKKSIIEDFSSISWAPFIVETKHGREPESAGG